MMEFESESVTRLVLTAFVFESCGISINRVQSCTVKLPRMPTKMFSEASPSSGQEMIPILTPRPLGFVTG